KRRQHTSRRCPTSGTDARTHCLVVRPGPDRPGRHTKQSREPHRSSTRFFWLTAPNTYSATMSRFRYSMATTPKKAADTVTNQVLCQPPASVATQATNGGPQNWPAADSCCIQPTEAAVACGLGASLTTR